MGRPRERPRGGTSWPRTRATTLVRPLAAVSPRCAERQPRGPELARPSPACARMPPRHPPPSFAFLVTHDAYDPPDLMFRPTARGLFRLWLDEWRLASLGLALGARRDLLRRSRSRCSCSGRSTTRSCRATAASCGRTWPGSPCSRSSGSSSTTSGGSVTSRVGIRIENELRRRLFAAYLTYPRAFYDRHATGQVRLARDERPLPRALLHRLGRHPDVPERDDDRRRVDRPAGGQPAARGRARAWRCPPSRT